MVEGRGAGRNRSAVLALRKGHCEIGQRLGSLECWGGVPPVFFVRADSKGVTRAIGVRAVDKGVMGAFFAASSAGAGLQILKELCSRRIANNGGHTPRWEAERDENGAMSAQPSGGKSTFAGCSADGGDELVAGEVRREGERGIGVKVEPEDSRRGTREQLAGGMV